MSKKRKSIQLKDFYVDFCSIGTAFQAVANYASPNNKIKPEHNTKLNDLLGSIQGIEITPLMTEQLVFQIKYPYRWDAVMPQIIDAFKEAFPGISVNTSASLTGWLEAHDLLTPADTAN